jgi:prepilin-type N-terminal cleavage/methylation domain-containing protein/prepilin-type processing-associated H-X9-DG protein
MNKRAFTLIELLVVIAIIAMLMGVLIPSLARAKEQGREVYCQSNLRQLHLAAMVYAESQRGYYPIAYYSVKSATERSQFCWDFTVRKFSNGTKKVQAGILWQGDTIEKVQQCPSFQGNSNMFADPFTGYNYNTSYIGHGQNESIVQPARTQEVRRPSSCVLFGDGQTVTGANKFMRSPLPSDADPTFPGRWGAVQGFRHSGNTNLIWCDGSVASKEQIFTGNNDDRTKEVLEEYNATHPRSPIGFLSADNSAYDLR